MKRRQKRHEPAKRHDVPELPEASPMPSEASPGGTEGVDPGWPGGSSNVGDPVKATVTLSYHWLPFLKHVNSTIVASATMRLEALPSNYSAGCST